jgi:regulator of extracellular matrix RemA (YlzA/DUF370 family)
MVMLRIPNTDKIVFVENHSGDHVWDMANFPDVDIAIRQEDVVRIGNWSGDVGGSGTINAEEVRVQGIINPNQLDLNASINHAKDMPRTDRGAIDATHRQRTRLVTIDSGDANDR